LKTNYYSTIQFFSWFAVSLVSYQENLRYIRNIINAKIYGNTFLKVIDEVVIRKVVDCHDKAEPSGDLKDV